MTALYDLSHIESKRKARGGYLLVCQQCGKWCRELVTKDGHLWTCAKCARG